MTSKLELYNNALTLHLGERKLSSLTENRKPRRVLDQIWDSGFVKSVLEMGQWNFAIRTVESEYNPDVTPDFGLQYAHDKPTDWVRTVGISLDGFFGQSLLRYEDEQSYIFTDSQTIYLKYVSDDASYGGDLSNWPESMSDYAALQLAALACMPITQSSELREILESKAAKAKRQAASLDGMNGPPKFMPLGSWARSRSGFGGRRTRFPDGSLGSG